MITAEYDTFYLVSSYVPNAGAWEKLERLDYRVNEWDLSFRRYLNSLEDLGKPVVWIGDLNVVH